MEVFYHPVRQGRYVADMSNQLKNLQEIAWNRESARAFHRIVPMRNTPYDIWMRELKMVKQSDKNRMDVVHPTLSFSVAFDPISRGILLGTTEEVGGGVEQFYAGSLLSLTIGVDKE
uniref:Uncharacterized protein n=1 Tax=Micrurus carvalhoi TaxID=3147026 RepID=A0A2H6N170_9SAUR